MVPDLLVDQWSGPVQWTVGSDQFGDCGDGPRPVQGVRTNGLSHSAPQLVGWPAV